MMIKGRKLEGRISVESNLTPENFPDKGQIKGRIAVFGDSVMQTGAKASNVELLKALNKIWIMSNPRHL
eukprot:1857530-Prorocentrum_lima.AAC.1